MRKLFTGIALSLSLVGAGKFAAAEDGDGFWHSVHIGYHRNMEWPEPFISADRHYAVAPFAVMIANGWQRQNLIGENYFEENKKLNNAGIERVRFILRQAPVEHRVLFVQRDLDDDITQKRVELVQDAVNLLQPKGPMPEVVISNMVPEGRSADIVSAEFAGYKGSAPTPRIGGASSGGGGSSSNSGGGSGSSNSSGSGSNSSH